MRVAFIRLMAVCVVALMALPHAADAQKRAAPKKQDRTLCVHNVPGDGPLDVRTGPTNDAGIIGQFPAKSCGVRLTGKCRSSWCEMGLGEIRGWVDTTFIGVFESGRGIPPAVARPAESPVAATTATPVSTDAPAASAMPVTAGAPVSPPEVPTQDVPAAAPPPAPAPAVASPVIKPATPSPSRHAAISPATPASRAEAPRPRSACVVRVDSGDTLRIRSGPGVNHGPVGGIPPGACGVAQAGGCRGAWCRVSWRGRLGWVNSYYLRRDG
jgi:SH3-like domain-containing protein